jgi:uncharacterized protein (TIGR02996 family)
VRAVELIAAIVANPDDTAAWHVYADWLLERSDVRGELIRLADLADAGNVDAMWRIKLIESNNEEKLLSPGLFAHTQHWEFEWHRGFIRRARLREAHESGAPFDPAALAALSDDPHGALLSVLELRVPYRDLDIGDELSTFRHLERLTSSGLSVAALHSDRLHTLVTDARSCRGAITGAWHVPSLTDLDWNRADEDVVVFTEPTSFLFQPPPQLRRLTLTLNARSIARLAEARCLRQLDSLELVVSSDDALSILRDHASAFAMVPKISLPYVVPTRNVDALRTLRTDLEQLLPHTTLEVAWDRLMQLRSLLE